MKQPKFTLSTRSISVLLGGQTHTVKKGAANFAGLRDALKAKAWDKLPKLLSVAATLEDWASGQFKVVGNKVQYKGEALPSELHSRMLTMVSKGESPTSLMRFWERLQKNPSFRSVNQLWPFLDHQGIPLSEDGCFLAYKSVTRDYKDHHTGTVDNKPGAKPWMHRNKISDDPREACHEGYHVGALAYAREFRSGSRIIICKVDPEDVVCVPYDCSHQKMRVCRYEVIGNYGSRMPSTSMSNKDVGVGAKPTKPSKGTKPKATKGRPERTTSATLEGMPSWRTFGNKDAAALIENYSLDQLRQYAKHLKIVGATKIPGGKKALVRRIVQVRD